MSTENQDTRRLTDVLRDSPATASPTPVPQRRKRRKKNLLRRVRPMVLVYPLGLLVIAGVALAVLASLAVSDMRRAEADLDTVLNSVQDKPATDLTLEDYTQIRDALAALHQSLGQVQQRTLPVQWVDFVNANLQTQFALLQVAIHATEGTLDFLAGLEPTIALLEKGGIASPREGEAMPAGSFQGEALGQRSAELLRAGRGRFLTAQASLDQAQTLLAGLELSDVSPEVLLEVETLQQYVTDMALYNALALEAPQTLNLVMGLEAEQAYLVLSQNNDELRPSGGYISTWGWFTVRNGRVRDYAYFPTTLETPDMPDPALGADLDLPTWWFEYEIPVTAAWDGSWHADFPETARLAAWYYNNGRNPHTPIQNVMSIDLTALQYILNGLGEVYVAAYDRFVTPENFRQVIYEIRAEPGDDSAHKDFLAALFTEMMAAWQAADLGQRNAINRGILQALQEKHLMLYYADEDAQAAIAALGWDGRQTPGIRHDYLMVADANIGSKSSSSVRRQITYDVMIDTDQQVESRLSLNYNFPATVAEQDPAVHPAHYGNLRDYFTLLQVLPRLRQRWKQRLTS
ncbi:MAG: DUF4012 domain-containing protein [Anaerolineae bacterium]|nr:DUF4012 domain-containing protein [Anaerolineae bacterium]